jgi:hypothetical protein
MAVLSCCISSVKLLPDAPGSGYSQSMSTPSRLYWVTKSTIVLTNVVRPPALAAKVSKAESLPPFQPPTAMSTLTLLAWPSETSCWSLGMFSTGWMVPLALGSANE